MWMSVQIRWPSGSRWPGAHGCARPVGLAGNGAVGKSAERLAHALELLAEPVQRGLGLVEAEATIVVVADGAAAAEPAGVCTAHASAPPPGRRWPSPPRARQRPQRPDAADGQSSLPRLVVLRLRLRGQNSTPARCWRRWWRGSGAAGRAQRRRPTDHRRLQRQGGCELDPAREGPLPGAVRTAPRGCRPARAASTSLQPPAWSLSAWDALLELGRHRRIAWGGDRGGAARAGSSWLALAATPEIGAGDCERQHPRAANNHVDPPRRQQSVGQGVWRRGLRPS